MLLFKRIKDLKIFLETSRNEGKKIGFVPTMGALHEGHISLVSKSNERCDFTVCSIFVNPTQFNESSDLEKYPRTTGQDIEKLVKNNCSVLFFPDESEIYPSSRKDKKKIDFGSLATCLEGEKRPGHFDGVAQVVKRLLEIVQPDELFLGLKDYQQFLIISRMVDILQMQIEVVGCPTIRENDGLALSSRNVRLGEQSRKTALELSQTLQHTQKSFDHEKIAQLKANATKRLSTLPNLKLEYFEIADSKTLKPLKEAEARNGVIACVAAYVGEVRLIDNIIIS